MKKVVNLLFAALLIVSLSACEANEPLASSSTASAESAESSVPLNESSVAATEWQKLEIYMLIEGEYRAELRDGNKYFLSNIKAEFDFDPDESWRTFVERNKDKGFEIGRDFYDKRDAVYYTYKDVKYEVVNAVNTLGAVELDKAIGDGMYAAMIPHRESIQGQWFYDVSNEPFEVEGYSEPFTRQGKTIILDTHTMTYVIRHEQLQKISANRFVRNETVIAEGSYTSNDGDTLGATITLDNGYVIKTTRKNSFVATLVIDGKSITAKTANLLDFYSF